MCYWFNRFNWSTTKIDGKTHKYLEGIRSSVVIDFKISLSTVVEYTNRWLKNRSREKKRIKKETKVTTCSKLQPKLNIHKRVEAEKAKKCKTEHKRRKLTHLKNWSYTHARTQKLETIWYQGIEYTQIKVCPENIEINKKIRSSLCMSVSILSSWQRKKSNSEDFIPKKAVVQPSFTVNLRMVCAQCLILHFQIILK